MVGGRRGVVVGRGWPCLWARQPGTWGWDPEVNRPKMACGRTGGERGRVRVWQVVAAGPGVGVWKRVDPGVGGEIRDQGGLGGSERKWAGTVVVASGPREA